MVMCGAVNTWLEAAAMAKDVVWAMARVSGKQATAGLFTTPVATYFQFVDSVLRARYNPN
jgi:hypothetical protein